MHIIAIGWIYVVLMMAITEKSVIAGIMTFTFYCAVPLSIVWFIVQRKKQKSAYLRKIKELSEAKIPRDDNPDSNDNLDSYN